MLLYLSLFALDIANFRWHNVKIFLGRVECRNIELIKQIMQPQRLDGLVNRNHRPKLFVREELTKPSFKITTGKLVMNFSLLSSGAYYKAILAFLFSFVPK